MMRALFMLFNHRWRPMVFLRSTQIIQDYQQYWEYQRGVPCYITDAPTFTNNNKECM